MKGKYHNIDEYIRMFPADVQDKLQEIRKIIKETVPEATETISYQMPAFKLRKILIYFAARKNHIGFYPTSEPIEFFKKELTNYKTTKGTIQFPLNKPIPADLIKRIVMHRAKTLEKNKTEF